MLSGSFARQRLHRIIELQSLRCRWEDIQTVAGCKHGQARAGVCRDKEEWPNHVLKERTERESPLELQLLQFNSVTMLIQWDNDSSRAVLLDKALTEQPQHNLH